MPAPLRLVSPPPPTTLHRRVDFFNNQQDKTIMIAALLGWRVRDIAGFTGMSIGQCYYRLHNLLKISVTECRGHSSLSQAILKQLKNTSMMNHATTQQLRIAEIGPQFDARKVKVLA